MMENGNISSSQMGKMMYLAITPTAILTTPAITYELAKQDAWISPIWAFSGFLALYAVIRLHGLYPGLNLVQACERIIGRFPGKMLAVIFSLYYLYLNGIILREYGEFVVGAFLLQTPLLVVVGSMVLVCAFAVRSGVEIVGRFAELFLPAFVTLFLLIIFPIIPDLSVLNMLPVMGEGIMPSIKGSFVLQTWFSEMITASFLLPFVKDHKKTKKTLWLTLWTFMLTIVVSNLATILLLGELTSSYTYPFLILARYINLADFFTHVSSLFMAIWVLGAFVKICVFFYVTVLCAAQGLNLSDYRPIVFPCGLLLILFSFWAAPNYQELTHAIAKYVTLSALTMFVFVPLVLLCLAWVKKRVQKRTA
ncbi:GerAB/ArcD/ProY family transporter [Brevibacillus marinus]|uniref:GerAB/ArcD/ProY family transporter n=1 Tax=Brevibacillus marinus TaxID=2496837 RepID=UPI0019D2B737|nr:endospore germination permease [Brevibacillus marinus]